MERICLFCRQTTTEAPPEHIIPEALGCPENAILVDGEVCQLCNNGVAHLDSALVDTFDFARLAVGQPGKRGKGPRVTGRPNFRAVANHGHLELFMNLGPGDVSLPSGHVIKPPSRAARSVQVELETDGTFFTARMRAAMFDHPKLVRALHKVAVESIALMLGRAAALDTSLDEVRRYVRYGEGDLRRVLCFFPTTEWRYENQLWPPYTSAHGYTSVVRLVGMDFVVDCSPGQLALPSLINTLSFIGYKQRWIVINDGESPQKRPR